VKVSLGWGRSPRDIDVPEGAELLIPPPLPAARIEAACAEALASPIGAPRLRGRVPAGTRVTIIVSDDTRDEPRDEMVAAVLREIEVPVDVKIAVAYGTHAPGQSGEMIDVGMTARGTRVRYPDWLVRSELVICTGMIRPHYFAGWGAGCKAIFPGLGHNDDIRQNHKLKQDPTARLGRADGNVCREDMEDAARLLPVPTFLLNLVLGGSAAVAGDLVAAHRAGVEVCRSFCQVKTTLADVIVTSDASPVSDSLYQASKLLVPAGLALRPGGVAVVAAECAAGTGPLKVVNEGIWAIGISNYFTDATIYLVSAMPREVVEQTYCRWAPSVESVLERHPGRLTVMPRAGRLIPAVQ